MKKTDQNRSKGRKDEYFEFIERTFPDASVAFREMSENNQCYAECQNADDQKMTQRWNKCIKLKYVW